MDFQNRLATYNSTRWYGAHVLASTPEVKGIRSATDLHKCSLCGELVARRGFLHSRCQEEIDARRSLGLARPSKEQRLRLRASWGVINYNLAKATPVPRPVPGRDAAARQAIALRTRLTWNIAQRRPWPELHRLPASAWEQPSPR
eukprot:781149-Alexandrium_andersonii.AAC.1